MKELPLLIEISQWRRGNKHIAGIDEVGRGALAGPVFSAAVIFTQNEYDSEIRDSKLIPAKHRNSLSLSIKDRAIDWSIGIASPAEIDMFNIREATFLAMRRAISSLRIKPDLILVDGNDSPGSDFAEQAIIDGDVKSFTIAAASIIAKVERDYYMQIMATPFPEYGFFRNKGYGTRYHIDAIFEHGPSEQHRFTFLGNILKDSFYQKTCCSDLQLKI
jgi:ribonuclease HII